jgi:YHS domain-containing protein
VAIDPICGRTVDESVSVPREGEEAAFCFCGERCRSLFLASLGSTPLYGQGAGLPRPSPPEPSATDRARRRAAQVPSALRR